MRLRWITGLKLPEPVWLLIGGVLLLLGLAVLAFPFLLWWRAGELPRGPRPYWAFAFVLVGGALMTIGWTEAGDAVRNMRGRGDGPE